MESFNQTKEIIAANVLNLANQFQNQVGGDSVALCSTAHPIDGNTYANRPSTDLDLNEASLQASLMQIRQFPDQAGLKVFARGRKLVVPLQLEYVAERLLKSELRPGTGDNDVNATVSSGALPEGYQVMDFLTSQFAWFVRTSIRGLIYLERIPFETDMQVDPITGNLLCTGYERYSAGYMNPRCIWGSFPTS